MHRVKLRYSSLDAECNTLGSPIKFTYMVALTNKVQTMLFFQGKLYAT